MSFSLDKIHTALDELYNCGWKDRNNERDYDPRGTDQWQVVLDLFRQHAAVESPETIMLPRTLTHAMIDAADMRDDDEPLSDWGKVRFASRQAIWDAQIAAYEKENTR